MQKCQRYGQKASPCCLSSLLCDLEYPEQPERPERAEPEAARPLVEVDPEDLEHGAGDDHAVEAVEAGLHEGGHAQRVHADAHLEDERAEEQELGVVWKREEDGKNEGLNITF